MISKSFIEALRKTGKPYHQIAWDAGLKPNQLYKITSGHDRPSLNDPRIKALCEHLNFPLKNAIER